MDLAGLSNFPFADIETFIIRATALALLLIGVYRLIKNELRR
jgi:hypothetical protein